MKISIVAAVSLNNTIGKNGKLPWNIKEDLERFKKITTGHHVLMGRATFESIGKALPKRQNIVITSDKKFKAHGIFVFDDPKKAVVFAKKRRERELMIIGGESIYKYFLEKSDRIYLTRILKEYSGDRHFPKIDFNKWSETEKETHKEKMPPFEFVVLERKRRPSMGLQISTV